MRARAKTKLFERVSVDRRRRIGDRAREISSIVVSAARFQPPCCSQGPWPAPEPTLHSAASRASDRFGRAAATHRLESVFAIRLVFSPAHSSALDSVVDSCSRWIVPAITEAEACASSAMTHNSGRSRKSSGQRRFQAPMVCGSTARSRSVRFSWRETGMEEPEQAEAAKTSNRRVRVAPLS